MRLEGDCAPRDYCVQYRETDLNFVARLMEQYGIFYFFEHTPTIHTLILANAPTAHRPCPSQTYARYNFSAGAVLEEDIITAWQMEKELRPGRYALNDYNFIMPSTSLAATSNNTSRLGGNERFEIYDYPGEYLHKAQGDTMVRLRMEEEETSHVLVNGQSTCRAFTSGYRFDLEGHPSRMMHTAYVLVEVHHVASMGHAYRGAGVMGGEPYPPRARRGFAEPVVNTSARGLASPPQSGWRALPEAPPERSGLWRGYDKRPGYGTRLHTSWPLAHRHGTHRIGSLGSHLPRPGDRHHVRVHVGRPGCEMHIAQTTVTGIITHQRAARSVARKIQVLDSLRRLYYQDGLIPLCAAIHP